jgi:glycosyltransferase involved in cell wall biosynthesis
MKPRVALVRGEALNTFETSAWAHLTRFDAYAVGLRGNAPVSGLPIPATYLNSLASLPAGRLLSRVAQRSGMSRDPDALFGLEGALTPAAIVHAAETAIPWSEQAGRHAVRQHKPLVLTCWETIPFLHEDHQRLVQRKDFLRGAARVFQATTQRAADALLEEGVDASRIVVIPPSVVCVRYAPQVRRDGPLRVLVPARVIAEKGVVEAVRAWSRLPPQLRGNSQLRIVGTGGQAGRVARAVEALRLGDSVALVGSVPHAAMAKEFAESSLVMLPSLPTPYWEEQFGMVLAEAMASGRAVLATASGAIPEVVADAGVLVPAYDVAALRDGLHQLLLDQSLRDDLGKRGLLRARRLFDAPVVARQLDDLYESLVSA